MGEAAIEEQRNRLAAWLQTHVPDARITLVETHVSILALADERVWKLKKAVRFPFVDLSTPELRRSNAEREVALNRRFAPDVYVGTVPLVDHGGEVVDTLVEMRRMPDERRLASMAVISDPTRCVDRIATDFARIHQDAPSGREIDRAGLPATLTSLWSSNLDELQPFAGSILDPEALVRVGVDAHRYIAGRHELFEQRIAGGRIRDGHGDLLADDVFCLDDGPRFLDCLEFDDALRFGDVVADIGFLAMDLERLGRADLAHRLLDRYRVASGDSWPASLADFYVAYRALVRSKVACLSLDNAPGAGTTARQLLSLSGRHLARGRIRLVLVGGAPATGKTTLSGELSRRTGWEVLHSDEVRKQLAGLAPTTSAADSLDWGLYTAEWNARTYGAVLESARRGLERGESVILDASWADPTRRAEAARVAAASASDLIAFVLTAPADVADVRAAARARTHADASDASANITARLRSRFAPWPAATPLDATEPMEVLVGRALDRVDAR
jgi:uncharacterized protein